jgi:hypothetical protein
VDCVVGKRFPGHYDAAANARLRRSQNIEDSGFSVEDVFVLGAVYSRSATREEAKRMYLLEPRYVVQLASCTLVIVEWTILSWITFPVRTCPEQTDFCFQERFPVCVDSDHRDHLPSPFRGLHSPCVSNSFDLSRQTGRVESFGCLWSNQCSCFDLSRSRVYN